MRIGRAVTAAFAAGVVVCSTIGWGGTVDAQQGPARYDGYRLVRVQLDTLRQLNALLAIEAIPWSCRVGLGSSDFALSPEQFGIVQELGLVNDVLHENIQDLLDQERQWNEQARVGGVAGAEGEDWFTVYRTWEEVNSYIDALVDLRPDLIEKILIGQSHEGRSIYGMRISAPGKAGTRQALLFNGCQHAREWISVMVPMYIADRLVRHYEMDAQIYAVMNEVEFLIVPIVNPDGYVYSHDEVDGDRMWRKNRSVNPGSDCMGVDLNRNWDFDWNGGESTSQNPCSQVFVGPGPMSEPEVAAMESFIAANPHIVTHIDFHNYSELILQPLGNTLEPPDDFEQINALALAMREAIFGVHGVDYLNGPPCETLYCVSGAFQDWTYAQGIMGYTVELRPSSFKPGFLLPPSEIIPTSEENFAGIMAMAEWVLENLGCPADLVGDGEVGVFDLLVLLGQWGPCADCSGDLNGSGDVSVFDLLILLENWGPCP